MKKEICDECRAEIKDGISLHSRSWTLWLFFSFEHKDFCSTKCMFDYLRKEYPKEFVASGTNKTKVSK